MKKSTILTAAALVAVLTLSACNSGSPAKTTAPAESVTPAEPAAPSDTTAAKTTAAEEQTTTAAESVQVTKTPIYTGICDKTYYREDATVNDWGQLHFDSSVMRVSTGLFVDSETSPDVFVPDEFEYSGETAELGTVVQIKAGDRVGDYVVKEAETLISAPWSEEKGEADPDAAEGFYPSRTYVALDGDVTLTGYFRYYFDEQYAISSGDIQFLPDSSYAGLPVPVDISGMDTMYGLTDFDKKAGDDPEEGYYDSVWGGNICIYTDAPVLHVGNLMNDYADRAELYQLLDGGSANCTKKVEVTLTDVALEWNDNFGAAYACTAKIKDAKVID